MVLNNATVIASVELSGTSDFQQRVPAQTQQMLAQGMMDSNASNLRGYFTDPRIVSETSPVLFGAIKKDIIESRAYKNPFSIFKRANEKDGVISEIHAHLIKARAVNYDAEDLLKKVRMNKERLFHATNRRDVYQTSITMVDLTKAFNSENGLYNLYSQEITSMLNSNEADEQSMFEELFVRAYTNGDTYNVTTPDLSGLDATGALSKEFIFNVRTVSARLKLIRDAVAYNPLGLPMFARDGELCLVTTPEIVANIDLNVLASAFNVSYADIKERVIVTSGIDIKGFQAALTFDSWYVVADVYRENTAVFDALALTENIYEHVHSIFSYSRAFPCVLFTTEKGTGLPKVTEVVTGVKAHLEDEKGTTVTKFDYDATKKYKIVNDLSGTITADDKKFPVKDFFDVSPDSVLYSISIVDDAGSSVEVSSATFVTRLNELKVQKKLKAGSVITIDIESTYRNPQKTNAEQTKFKTNLKVTVI